MNSLMVPATVVGAIFLGFFGFFCVFRPVRVQESFQRAHDRSHWFVKNLPGSKLVFKAWYPTYLRFMGVFAWMLAVFYGYVVYRTIASR